MALPFRYKAILVLALSALSVYLGCRNLVDRTKWQRSSDGIEWSRSSQGLEVASVPGQLSNEYPRLTPGSLLLSVNDIPVGSLDDLTEVREFLVETLAPGTPASYLFQDSSGSKFPTSIVIKLEPALASRDFFLIVLAFAYLVVGLHVFVRNWNSSGAFHFYLICLLAFSVFLLSHSGRANLFDVVVYVSDVLALLVLPPLFLHFCLRFPRRFDWPRSGIVVYLPSIFLATVFLIWLAGWLQPVGLPRGESAERIQEFIHLLHFILYFLAGAVTLIYGSRKAASSIQRQQLKWISGGALAGLLPFTFLYAVPYSLHWQIYPWMEASVLGLALIPLSFGYAITRYRLMDVDLIFKRSAAYFMATAILVGTYIGLIAVVGRTLQSLSNEWGFLLFGLGALGVAFLFAPLNNRIQQQIDRYFYKDSFDYRQSFNEFSQTLNEEVDLPKLAEKICDRISKTLDLEPVGVFLKPSPTAPVYELYEAIGLPPGTQGPSIEIEDEVFTELKNISSLFRQSESLAAEQKREELSRYGFRFVQPLQAHERIIGFLALGNRRGDRLINTQDVQLVETLAGYASIAIDNAALYRSLESNAAELSELKAYSDNVIESITLGVVALSPEGLITIWNTTMESIYGLHAHEVVGRSIEDVFPYDLIQVLRQFVDVPDWTIGTTRLIRKTHLEPAVGDPRLVNLTVAPFVSTQNLNKGTLLIFDDVTQRVQLESQLLQAERLSSIGLFAAGVAHEVNTPLAGISSYAQMLLKKVPKDDDSRELLERIEQQSFRASRIVNNLLNFARVNERDVSEVNLNMLMLETMGLLDHSFQKAGVQVNLELDPGLPVTLGSGGKLQQVFMNLFLNARDAMPKGGNLKVRTFQQDDYLVVEVQDTGKGISRDHVKRIYDPFFTTKAAGKGTGLGLSISYGIIQEHSGRISVESRKGHGTTFTVELPLRRIN